MLPLESIYADEQLLIIDHKVFNKGAGTTVDAGVQHSLLVAEAYDSVVKNVRK